jgi:Zn-dependent peptidase ImmA (M78 family)
MKNQKPLTQKALFAAMEVRQRTNHDILQPVCIYDLAAEMGVEVRFISLPSLEGMYSSAEPPTIVIGAQRPAGRRAYTCAHELGHHVFRHGTRVDLLGDAEGHHDFLEEEFLAQAFAGFLLMPKLAVACAFTNRGLRPESATAPDFYRIARFFGVGYSALVHHIRGISVISPSKADSLLRTNPAQIRQQILPDVEAKSLLPVDTAWQGRAVDTETGEIIITPSHVGVEGDNLSEMPHSTKKLFKAVKPGFSRLIDTRSDWAAYIRISRCDYEGRSVWRHLPEEEE